MKRTCIYQNTHTETEAETMAPSGPSKSTSLYPFTNCGHHSTQEEGCLLPAERFT